MKERLIWIMLQLQKLQDDDRIRSDGNQVFIGIKTELADVLAGYVEPEIGQLVSVVMTAADLAAVIDGIKSAVAGEIQASDVVIMAAIQDALASLVPDAAAAVQEKAEPAPAPATV